MYQIRIKNYRRRQACVRLSTSQLSQAKNTVAQAEISAIKTAMAAAAPISPASSKFKIAMAATLFSGEYKNTTAEIVVMALMKKYRAMSTMAGVQMGRVTRQKVL